MRYVASAHLVRRILLRSALFALPASGLWALLPIVAEGRLALDSAGYGLLLGALGIGALAGVFLLPLVRARVADNVVLVLSAIFYGVGATATAFLPFAATFVLLIVAGAAWIGTLTVLNASLQLTLPQWVRARGAATYIFVFMGTMAIGSFLWGLAAQWLGAPVALLATGILLAIVAATVAIWPLHKETGRIDRTFDLSWPTPTLVFEPGPADGPVMIQLTYRVAQAHNAEFVSAMNRVRDSRRRGGAIHWRLYRSGEHADQLVETFVAPSWSEYRRQQTARLTGRDREIRAAATALSEGEPEEEHFFPAR